MMKEKLDSNPLPPDGLWETITARDASADGQFVFAVSSTKIYCRPSCPSRRPRRDRVSFFSSPQAAERAGFRACLRCHPDRDKPDPQAEMVQKLCRLIEANVESSLNLESLGQQLGVSPFHLQRVCKSVLGITPQQYLQTCRANRFRLGVQSGDSVTTAMYNAGYGSSSRLYERANAELGMTPATYRRGGTALAITYTIVQSSLGQLLVAATDRGVCCVRLGDNAKQLEAELRREFPAAKLNNESASLADAVKQIVEVLSAKRQSVSLPLDLRATAFQRQVWEALQQIPYGETRSYSEVARAIGQPKSVRAVARACASNPVALVIPCHRVIREDQSLGGYRWGLERKKRLLAQERQVAKNGSRDK